MHSDGESEVGVGILKTEQCLSDGQMSAGGDGQVFGETLNGTENERLNPVHLFSLFAFEHDGEDFDHETQHDKDGRHGETTGVEHGGIEDVGIIASAAAEEDVSDGKDDDADDHQDVVDGAEG